MRTERFIPVPKEPTEADVKRFRSIEKIEICVSSEFAVDESAPQDRDGRVSVRPKVKTVVIEKESQMVPELVMGGPKRLGEVNAYIACDGMRYYFSAKTGEALGGELRPIKAKPLEHKLVNLGVRQPSRA